MPRVMCVCFLCGEREELELKEVGAGAVGSDWRALPNWLLADHVEATAGLCYGVILITSTVPTANEAQGSST